MLLIWLFLIFFLIFTVVAYFLINNIYISNLVVPLSAHQFIPISIEYVLESVYLFDIVLSVRMFAPNNSLEDCQQNITASTISQIEFGTRITFTTLLKSNPKYGNGPRTVTFNITADNIVQAYAARSVIVTV
jgi:hypothetical protein